MLIQGAMHPAQNTKAASVKVWFLRILAVICFVSALHYWSRLLGISDPELRFDLFAPHWRMVTTVLAVLLPVAALGLWMAGNWGIVVWILAIGIEIYIYGPWASGFAPQPMIVIAHVASAVFVLVISVIVFLQHRRALLSLH